MPPLPSAAGATKAPKLVSILPPVLVISMLPLSALKPLTRMAMSEVLISPAASMAMLPPLLPPKELIIPAVVSMLPLLCSLMSPPSREPCVFRLPVVMSPAAEIMTSPPLAPESESKLPALVSTFPVPPAVRVIFPPMPVPPVEDFNSSVIILPSEALRDISPPSPVIEKENTPPALVSILPSPATCTVTSPPVPAPNDAEPNSPVITLPLCAVRAIAPPSPALEKDCKPPALVSILPLPSMAIVISPPVPVL